MKILIDIDGVVRNMSSHIQNSLNKRKFTYEEGSVIFDLVKANPKILTDLPPTKYCTIIKEYIKNPEFVSYQKKVMERTY